MRVVECTALYAACVVFIIMRVIRPYCSRVMFIYLLDSFDSALFFVFGSMAVYVHFNAKLLFFSFSCLY